MKNLENVKPLGLNEDQIMDLLKLYQFKGKDYYYDNLLKGDCEAILRKTIKSDILAISKALNLDITDPRKKTLLKKDCEPKNKDEQFFINIKNTLIKFMGFYKDFELVTQEFQNLANDLFANIEQVKYRTYKTQGETRGFLTSTKVVSQRNELENMLSQFSSLNLSGRYEVSNLITNFIVDFKMQEIFTNKNEILSLFILYVLLVSSGFTLFKYTSFFELYFKYSKEFKDAEIKAMQNYEEGYSDTRKLNAVLVKLLLEGYDKVEDYINEYSFDGKNSKEDNIISIIYHLPQEFTKDDIRAKDPISSDSTINRALAKLSKQKKIRSMGFGRSAKWYRIEKTPTFADAHQINLFDLEEEETNN